MTRMTQILFATALIIPVVGFATPTEALDTSAETSADLATDGACDPGDAAEPDLTVDHAQSSSQGAAYACFGLPSGSWVAFNLCIEGHPVCTAFDIMSGDVRHFQCETN